jgi:hypothetical protein
MSPMHRAPIAACTSNGHNAPSPAWQQTKGSCKDNGRRHRRSTVPLIGLGLVGGAGADAFEHRRLVLVTTTILAIVPLLFALQAVFDLRSLWLLSALIAVQSCLFAVEQPARRTLPPPHVRPLRRTSPCHPHAGCLTQYSPAASHQSIT